MIQAARRLREQDLDRAEIEELIISGETSYRVCRTECELVKGLTTAKGF